MLAPNEIVTQIGPTVIKWLAGLLLTGIGVLFMWPFRKAHKEWKALKENISATHKELVQQRTNCLATLQSQGVTQIELLTKSVTALDGIRLDLAEQTGYLKASMSVSPRRRRAVAKK